VIVPVLVALVIGLVVGGGVVLFLMFGRVAEEGIRQFDAGLREGQWLGDVTTEQPAPASELILPGSVTDS
jgi:hypothetical protein